MISRWKYKTILLVCFTICWGGCAGKQISISGSFGRENIITIDVPKYESSTIKACLKLDLLPKDKILKNVDVYIDAFGYKRDVDYDNDKNSVIINLEAPYTITNEQIDIRMKIICLLYHNLRVENKDREVYEIAYFDRIIRYETSPKEIEDDTEVSYKFNIYGLEDWTYRKLYREIHSLGSFKKRSILKKLDDDFINKIRSDSLKKYIMAAMLLMKKL